MEWNQLEATINESNIPSDTHFKSKQNDTGMDDRGELVDVAQMLKALLEDKVRGAKSRKWQGCQGGKVYRKRRYRGMPDDIWKTDVSVRGEKGEVGLQASPQLVGQQAYRIFWNKMHDPI